MASRNKYYCIVGIDHMSSSWNPSIPYRLEARLYDITTGVLVGETSLTLKEEGSNNLEEYLDKWTRDTAKYKCYRYMLFPGVNIKSGDICRLLVQRAPTLKCRGYAEGHHHKLTIFDKGKDCLWRVLPDPLFDFNFIEDSKAEFDKFCDFMIKEVGLEDFCKHNNTAMKQVRKSLVIRDEDVNPIPDSAMIMEQEFGMNSGGRVISKYAYEVLPVIAVDVNSLYTQVMLEKKFSNTQLRKVKPVSTDQAVLSYTDPDYWQTYINTRNAIDGEGNYQMRVVCEIEDAVLKDTNNPMNMHSSMYIKRMAPDLRHKGVTIPRFSGVMMFFIDELVEFCQKYSIKRLKPRIILGTFCGRLSKNIREKAFSLFRDSKDKKSDPHLASTSKIQKNALAGMYQMNPAGYAKNRDYKAKQDEVYALISRDRKKYPNVLAGAELTKHGRDIHKRLQDFFESRGCEVVYANTDSLYLLATSNDERKNIMETIRAYNDKNYHELKYYCKDLYNWCGMARDIAVGGLKVEFDGLIVHGGVNKIFKADRSGQIIGGSISGYNWEDILHDGESRNIYSMTKGRVIHDVLSKVNGNVCTQLRKVEWVF